MPKRSSKRSAKRPRKGRKTPSPRQMVASVAMHETPASWDPMVVDATPMRPPGRNQICTFQRTYSLATLQANTGDTLYAFYWTIGNAPNYTDFTNLFDQYRILEAVVSFVPYVNTVPSGSANYPGIIGTWIDYDDASLPANLQEGQQYESYQRNNCTVPFVRVIKPRSAVATYAGATANGYGNVYGMWQDSANPNVQHYGLKLCIHNSTYSSSTNIYEIEATVTYQCRSPH